MDALEQLARWVPGYLEFDDSRSLAKKAIWALGSIEGETAQGALAEFAHSTDTIVAEEAGQQLDRRHGRAQ